MKRHVVLLLQGWIRNKNAKEYYAKTIHEFEKKGYDVFVPDMPGFGEAPVPKQALTLHDYAAFVQDYITKYKIQPDVIVGHSFGGRVIIEYLSKFPFTGKGVVLSGTPGYPSIKKSKMLMSLLIAKLGGTILSLPLLSRIKETIRGWYYYIVGARDFYRAEGSMRPTFKNIVSESLDAKMKIIHVPTLLLWGDSDVIVPVVVAEKMKHTIANAVLTVIPKEGHGIIVNNPSQFVAEVSKFLKTL